MLYSWIAQAGFIAMVVTCLVAGALGDRWGRLAAGLYAVNWLLVALLQDRRPHVFHTADFITDLIGAALAIWLAGKANRAWALAFAAFQVLGVTHYLVAVLDPRVTARVSIATSYLWEIGDLFSLLAAAVDGALRRRR